ncbi:Uncharacterized protein QTN25_009012 [Entamoeba marina]
MSKQKSKTKSKLEMFYLMSVAMYVPDFKYLKTFCCVSRKCKEAALELKVNPNYQDTMYYREKLSLRDRRQLFYKEMQFFNKIDTLRGSLSLMKDLPENDIARYSLFDLFYEGAGSIDLFKKIQPRITSLEFVSNGMFEGNDNFEKLKKLKVVFIQSSLVDYIKRITTLLSNGKIPHLTTFVVICYDLNANILGLVKACASNFPDCNISVVVKGSVDKNVVLDYTPYATVCQTSPDAMYYGVLEKEFKVVELKQISK